jgi:RHS repeat-associated protein
MSDGTYNYKYDNNGNLILQTNIATGATRAFTWDYRNRLVEVTDTTAAGVQTLQVDYTYDGFDRRISETVDEPSAGGGSPVTTNFVYDRDNVLLEFTGAPGGRPALSRRYLSGGAVDQVLAEETPGGAALWHLVDQVGTTHDLVDDSGAVVDHLRYNAFGDLVEQSSSSSADQSRYLFEDRVFDPATGLYDFRARTYSPTLGRFLSEDPLGVSAGDPNQFVALGDDPPTTVDPFGLHDKRIKGKWRSLVVERVGQLQPVGGGLPRPDQTITIWPPNINAGRVQFRVDVGISAQIDCETCMGKPKWTIMAPNLTPKPIEFFVDIAVGSGTIALGQLASRLAKAAIAINEAGSVARGTDNLVLTGTKPFLCYAADYCEISHDGSRNAAAILQLEKGVYSYIENVTATKIPNKPWAKK